MRSQYNLKLVAQKEGDALTNNMNKNTCHSCPHHSMWNIQRTNNYEIGIMVKYKAVDSKSQTERDTG